jgi:hypothetical protein
MEVSLGFQPRGVGFDSHMGYWRRGGMADTTDLKSVALYGRAGSSPAVATVPT